MFAKQNDREWTLGLMCRTARGWYKPRLPNFDQLYAACESPIERLWLSIMSAKLADPAEVKAQENFKTPLGRYRADFVVRANGRTVVVECDGQKFHNFADDERRDLDLLCHVGVDTVIRFRGCDIHYMREQCVATLERFAPELFGNVPMVLEPGVVMFGVMASEWGCKPIVRSRFPVSAVMEHRRIIEQSRVAKTYGMTPDRASAIVEFRTPYWDWKLGPAGDSTVSLSEGFIELMEGWLEQAAHDPMEPLASRF